MISRLSSFKLVAVLGCFLALAACSKKNTPDLNAGTGPGAAAVPGSEQDFTVNVGDRVFFLEDKSTLSPEAQETLRRQAQWLNKYGRVTVQVEGHADERGTREYNIALSARRATAAIPDFPRGCRQPHLVHRLWQGAPGRTLRRRAMLVAEPPCGHRHHRWGEIATGSIPLRRAAVSASISP